MGTTASSGSTDTDGRGPSLCRGTVFPGARGECLEDPADGCHVHLGSGKKHWDGWINVETYRGAACADVIAPLTDLPIVTGTADRVAAVHVLEHFQRWTVDAVLREWIRILKPGGWLIVEVPSMDKVIHYLRSLPEGFEKVDMQMTSWAVWGDPRHHDPHMMHHWGYCSKELQAILQSVGLVQIHEEDPRYHRRDRDMRITGRKP